MGQRNLESTATSVLLIFKIVVIVFLVPSAAHSQRYQKPNNITDLFNCPLGQQLLIKEANFSETTSLKLCHKDGNSSNTDEKMNVADCSNCFLPSRPEQQDQKQQQKCVAQFSPQFLREIYRALDSGNETLKDRVIQKANSYDKQYTIVSQCIPMRTNIIDPCVKKISKTNSNTIAIFPSMPMRTQPCKKNCTVQLQSTNNLKFEQQFLTQNGASSQDDAVSYQILHRDKSWNLTRINNPYLKKEEKGRFKNIHTIRLQFRIENVSDVSRFWLHFTGKTVKGIECKDIKDKTEKENVSSSDSNGSNDDDTTTKALLVTSSVPIGFSRKPHGTSGEQISHQNKSTKVHKIERKDIKDEKEEGNDSSSDSSESNDGDDGDDDYTTTEAWGQNSHGDKRWYIRYLFAIPAVLAFLAVIICIVILVWKKSDYQPSRKAETSHMLQTAPKSNHRTTTDDTQQNRCSYFQNQAYSDSIDETDNARPSRRAFPPLVGHVTGNGSDDRQYGTLDHHGVGRKWRRREEDDYNHVMMQGTDGDYQSCQRETGRQVVIDNPYDHTS